LSSRIASQVAWNADENFGGELTLYIAAILDFKRRGRLGRVERATKGEGIEGSVEGPLPSSLRFYKSNMAATMNRDFDFGHFGTHGLRKTLA